MMNKEEARIIAEEIDNFEKEKEKAKEKKDGKQMAFPGGIFLLSIGLMLLICGCIVLSYEPGTLGETLSFAYNLGLSNGASGVMFIILGAFVTMTGIGLLRSDFRSQINDAVKTAIKEAEEDYTE